VVIGGEAGTTPGDASYCVEEIAFKDHLKKTRRAVRDCGSTPQIGEKVTVRYWALDPSARAYVDGDNQFAGFVFWSVILGLWLCWKLCWKVLTYERRPRFGTAVPVAATELDPTWNSSAAEEFRRLGPVYPSRPDSSG
jgi:hypothetical protein